MELTDANYYSAEADAAYMSNSQLSRWIACAAAEKARQAGAWKDAEANHFLGGQYAHCLILEPHKVQEFVAENPDLYTVKEPTHEILKSLADLHGVDLKGAKSTKEQTIQRLVESGIKIPRPDILIRSEYAWCGELVEAFNRQAVFADLIARGIHEVSLEFELGGIMWRCKIDNLRCHDAQFDDLKFMRDFSDQWDNASRQKVAWYEVHNYRRQMAVYREAIRQNYGADYRPNILGISKQSPPDFAWIQFRDTDALGWQLHCIREALPDILRYKSGEWTAPRCEQCDYCRSTKQLTAPTVA